MLLSHIKDQQWKNPHTRFAIYLCRERSSHKLITAWHQHTEPGSCAVSGVITSGLSQGGKAYLKGGPLANTQKKSWEMRVNPYMYVHTKVRHRWKILRKTQKKQFITKQTSTKYGNLRWVSALFSHLASHGGRFSLLYSRQLRHYVQCECHTGK